MKCKQCGWDNPDGRDVCEKCNNLLVRQRPGETSAQNYDTGYPAAAPCNGEGGAFGYGMNPQPAQTPQPAAVTDRYCPECDTLLPPGARECPVCHTPVDEVMAEMTWDVCPECGATLMTGLRFCPNCGSPLPQPQYPSAATVNTEDTVPGGPLAASVPQCTLQMAGNASRECPGIVCTGEEVDLYRGNTDPANNTIARDIQARLTFDDGKWCIEDCSALQTTYVRPGRKMELRDGDVIVMGNREFIFKS